MEKMNTNEGSTEDDLYNAIRESLDRKGTLCRIRALLRSEIFSCLEDSIDNIVDTTVEEAEERRVHDDDKHDRGTLSTCFSSVSQQAPTPPIENTIINEMIREYMIFNGYNHTTNVFSAEVSVERKRGGDGFIFDDNLEGGPAEKRKEKATLSSSYGREVIMQDLGIADFGIDMVAPWVTNDKSKQTALPLLYGIVEALKRQKLKRGQMQIP